LNTPPEQWADFIANETIEDPARLLRIEKVFVDLTGLFDGVLYSALSNLVEDGTTGILEIQGMFKRPGDKFTLTIRVWSQEYFAGTLRCCFQLVDELVFFSLLFRTVEQSLCVYLLPGLFWVSR